MFILAFELSKLWFKQSNVPDGNLDWELDKNVLPYYNIAQYKNHKNKSYVGFFSRVLISCTTLRELGLFILLKTYFYLNIEKDKLSLQKSYFYTWVLSERYDAFKVSVCLRS